VRIACLAATVALALAGSETWAQSAPVTPVNSGHPEGAAPAAPSQQILVSGLAPGAVAADIQRIVQKGYQQAVAAAGHPATLSQAQLQGAADVVTAALKKAGYADAHAYLPDQVLAFTVSDNAGLAAQSPAAPPAPRLTRNVVPAVKDRDAGAAAAQQLAVRGFRVKGVGEHPRDSITPASMQALADAQLQKLGGGAGQVIQLDFAQLQQVADVLTDRYRKAGFIFGTAFLPAQTVGTDQTIEIRVLEGELGRVIVKGAKRYRPAVIAATAVPLKGKALRKGDIDTAMLYARDLPGVAVSSTFQPGEHTGETDLLMVANEAKRPYTITTGANNYGTDLTGKYRAQLGVTWNSPLGIGDSFTANIDYALDPQNNVYGTLAYRVPMVVPGLSGVVGATRSELQLSNGTFAALDVKGPSSSQYAGADWKFVNTQIMQMQATLHFIREQSRLSSTHIPLSDERFDVGELTWGMSHTDQRFHGVDLLQVGLRKSIADDSHGIDLVSPNHASSFLTTRLSYTRLQFLTKSQRLYFKLGGQYTSQALAPLEQFVIGGPDSVRAYPIADALTDRGYYASLEYHVDAPGFGNMPSPFYGRPWRELLEFETFVDYGRGFAAGADRANTPPVTLKGYGAGLIFRLPRFHRFEFHLDGSLPIGGPEPSDKNGYHIYSRFGFTF